MYTCNTCSLQFPLPEDQRSHMKSDWHRYNLKRRVAALPAIDEALFNEKVSRLAIVNDVDEEVVTKQKVKQLTKKEQRKKEKEELLEKKRQLLETAKRNMMNSLKTEGKISVEEPVAENVEEPIVEETVVAEEVPIVEEPKPEEPIVQATEEIPEDQLTDEQLLAKIMAEKLKNKVEIPPEVCLFCNKKYQTFEICVDHMFKNHGFYIPEQKYLTDKLGLVNYMAEKIGVGNLCIVCDYQGRTLEAVRAHMLSKRHCRIPYESEMEKMEISDFYDFSSTYDSLKPSESNDDWEDVDDDEEIVEGSGSEVEEDEELPQHVSYDDGVELHLPSGVKVGHRSLARYYRQNLRPEIVLSEGQGTVIAAESRSMVSVGDRMALMEKKRIWRTEKDHQDRDDRRAQKFINNQPHYRDQLLQ